MGVFDDISGSISEGFNKASSAIDSLGSSLNLRLGSVLSLGSDWQGLNNNLIARFFVVKKTELGWMEDPLELSVRAPILEGAEVEYVLNWQSPFEETGVDKKVPAIANLIQSGALGDTINQALGMLSETVQESVVTAKIQKVFSDNVGKTGVTKLNSIQIFAGMPPIKINMKLLFRARINEQIEVMKPIHQLLSWAVPQELSGSSALVNMAKNISSDKGLVQGTVDTILPSKAPKVIGMEYKGRVYKPMVIESISDPITSPTTSSGGYASAEVNLSIASLTAWDKADIDRIYGSGILGIAGIIG